uniref:EF-hand domain-containing protein n=1 Tax=Tetraselmis sp. GSL018 TaxID=582737 RepID=A0A061RYI6_9CHLO|mmetsp:Transcript_27280/g.64663  ORF Transcript_27280/g.64663 Transcript_27280/m.64663 type:complete len:461 (-) Transcript_27280:344-1726(-)|eukprot:CAMPEP_0177613414 /NCGR_PEP_ID=MMETSP0419_2-20121207/21945_1 /TAXON_ID=582737 /ORGANISM="Tetraselmis sp., Strain GSL018" /LENGTH=460 /DNA_ID=CAMNT_0019110075 /DNA_START=610 /DNA_END=1992 /DNA_ORIENTATION=-
MEIPGFYDFFGPKESLSVERSGPSLEAGWAELTVEQSMRSSRLYAGSLSSQRSRPLSSLSVNSSQTIEVEDSLATTRHPPGFRQRLISKAMRKVKDRSRASKSELARDFEREEEEMRQCFIAMDEDGSGVLEIEELEAAFREAGAYCSKTMLRGLIRLLRQSQRQNRTGSTLDASDPYALTFKDFQALLKMRKFTNWDNDKNALTSTDDLPLPITLVAYGHRRRLILKSYLNNDFLSNSHLAADLESAQLVTALGATPRATNAGDEAGEMRSSIQANEEFEDLTTEARERAVSVLPRRLRANFVAESEKSPKRPTARSDEKSQNSTRSYRDGKRLLPRIVSKVLQKKEHRPNVFSRNLSQKKPIESAVSRTILPPLPTIGDSAKGLRRRKASARANGHSPVASSCRPALPRLASTGRHSAVGGGGLRFVRQDRATKAEPLILPSVGEIVADLPKSARFRK